MENVLRMAIIFVWSMFFGFFSVMGFIDETMTAERKTVMLGGLLIILAAYLAFEWLTRSKEPIMAQETPAVEKEEKEPERKDPQTQLDERVLRRLQLYTKDREQELQAAINPTQPTKRKKPALSTSKR